MERHDGTLTVAGQTAQRHGEATGASAQLTLDLGELLIGAAQRAAEATGATSAIVWARDTEQQPTVAAQFGDVDVTPPSAPTIEALFALPGATDLRAAGVDPSLFSLSHERALRAAVPVTRAAAGGNDPQAVAVLLLGFPPAAAVRPRTLAALDRIASRLRTSVTTAMAATRLAELDAEIFRMTRLATLGELLAEVVHEVRNPLVSVKTFLQMLPGHLDDPDFHTNFRSVVLDEARRMERLLDSLLRHAGPDAANGGEARAALGRTIESIGRLLEKRAINKELTLVIDIAADLPEAAISEDALRQIVLNLALNAFEATREGGTVRVAAVQKEPDARDAGLELIVDDEGPGVSAEDRERVFDPFFSTRSERPVGLGLTVCSRLARDADGTIEIEDAPKGGARFRVWLPAA